MKQPNSLLKLAAVVSSVLLVGGFVCYRAGAFDWLRGTSARAADSTSADGMFSGSKSGRVLFAEPVATQPTQAAADAAIMMGGSKSISIGPLVAPPSPQTASSPAGSQTAAPSR